MTDSYRRRLNRAVWAYSRPGHVHASLEWTDRAAWRSRMVRASVWEDNHGRHTPDSYRDRLATYLPSLAH